MALGGCLTPKPAFDIPTLKPTEEADQVVLTGWLQLGDQIRLYPEKKHLGDMGKATCISGVLLSLAGRPGPEFNDRRVAVSGYLRRFGGEGSGSLKDECGSGLILLADGVSVP
ncbi:MAG: hypothetical protein Q8R02_01535 [Hyphomonadaceae bacterium]|nr:hypothetical protein [Hyphomonadaceae bacterium]